MPCFFGEIPSVLGQDDNVSQYETSFTGGCDWEVFEKITDTVASSIFFALSNTRVTTANADQPSRRVLVFGTESFLRSQRLCSLRGMPSDMHPLDKDILKKKVWDTDAIFYTDDIRSLKYAPTNKFDAVLCFDLDASTDVKTPHLLLKLRSLLQKDGYIAGTSVFKGLCGTVSSRHSLKSFRGIIEDNGFFVHTAMDLRLEGYPDIGTTSIRGRFLATKIETTNIEWRESSPAAISCKSPPIDKLYNRLMISSSNVAPRSSLRSSLTPSPSVENLYRTSKKSSMPVSNCDFPTSIRSSASVSRDSLWSITCDEDYDDIAPSHQVWNQVDKVIISGVSVGLPNCERPDLRVYDDGNFDRIFRGENFISQLTKTDKKGIIDQRVFQLKKKDGKRIKNFLTEDSQVPSVASKVSVLDLVKEYNLSPGLVETLDTSFQLAIAGGLEALKQSGIILGCPDEKNGQWALPKHMRDETGVIFASSFPVLESAVKEVTRAHTEKNYEFNRKLLFQLLVLANCQLAELIKARGPNTHVNNACASTTHAISLAEDWIKLRRCRRVIVIAGDNITSSTLLSYVGSGFAALGAPSLAPTVAEAAAPFDKRRSGMILGSGGCGLVLESLEACLERNGRPQVEIMGSHISNSAYHACSLDKKHISSEFDRFLQAVEDNHGLTRSEIAPDCIYFSHETGTSAYGGCAKAEMDMFSHGFGNKDKAKVLITNTKGMTGHPMSVGIEDVVAVKSLDVGLVPPVVNYQKKDPVLGDIQLSRGGVHDKQYALRFGAGFGSQVVFLLMKKYISRSR